MAAQSQPIVHVNDYNPETDMEYGPPKAYANGLGGKNVPIKNRRTKKGTYLSTPLMLTWGCQEFVDEKSGKRDYTMSLQFPNDDWKTPEAEVFLNKMKAYETKIKADAVKYSKEWMNKGKMSAEVVEALWSPMLHYPKNKETGEPDYSRAPTLRLKVPFWSGEFNTEIYNVENKPVFPNENGHTPMDLITSGSNVAVVMQSGGLWFANGKFGTTWKLFQAVVKPRASLRGVCHVKLGDDDKQKLQNQHDPDEDENGNESEGEGAMNTQVEDSDEEETAEPEPEPEPAPAPAPVKKVKKVVKKKRPGV